MYKPELVNCIKNYNAKKFVSDFVAGIIVGIVALPLSIAFAIASGCSPETGLYTAIVAGFCISAFGGTRVQIGGPTGAFTVLIYGIVNNPELGMSGLATATLLAGILLILMGIFKLGGLVKFIPYTIVVGFTAGIALTIATGQLGDFFGLTTDFSNPVNVAGKTFEKMPGDFTGKILVFAHFFNTINWYSFLMALICLVIIFLWPKVTNKIPGSLVVIILATVVNLILDAKFNLHTDIIKDRYTIPKGIPTPTMANLSISTIRTVFPSAVSIAVLAAIESLLSAVVADGMIGTKHDSNSELIGQGIANIFSPLFGGLPATGAIARTATNIKNGGRTPIAGIVSSLVLLVIMVFLGQFVVYIPMAALSAVLMSVAWNMAGIPSIRKLLKGQKSDICVLLVTFLVTVFVDLTVAIALGLVFAAFFFIKKMIDVSEIHESRDIITGGMIDSEKEEELDIPQGVLVYKIDGPLFFGTVRKFELAVERAHADCKKIIFRMENIYYLDASGIQALEQCLQACKSQGIQIIIAGIHTQPYMLFEKYGMRKKIGEENIYATVYDALEAIKNK